MCVCVCVDGWGAGAVKNCAKMHSTCKTRFFVVFFFFYDFHIPIRNRLCSCIAPHKALFQPENISTKTCGWYSV